MLISLKKNEILIMSLVVKIFLKYLIGVAKEDFASLHTGPSPNPAAYIACSDSCSSPTYFSPRVHECGQPHNYLENSCLSFTSSNVTSL